MQKRMRSTTRLVHAIAVLMTAAGLAGCPGGSIGGLNLMGGGELLQGGAMVVGSVVQGVGSVVTDGAAATAAAGTNAAEAMETAPVAAGKPDHASKRNDANPPLPYTVPTAPLVASSWVAGNAVLVAGVRAGPSPAVASCRAECPDGATVSIGCPAGKAPVCQCERKPYAACALPPAPAAGAPDTAALRTRN